MALIDKKVDEIWDKVYKDNPALMFDWIRCFSDNDDERKQKSKEEIKMTLSDEKHQTDPKKNFFWRLMSREHQSDGYKDKRGATKRRDQLAMIFLQVMIEDSYWKDFIATTLALKQAEAKVVNPNLQHTCQWNEANQPGLITTRIHEAARREKVADVKRFASEDKTLVNNQFGYSPLHFAAMAINPNMEIAELLIDSVTRRREFLDKQTDEEWGRNTALHIAAGNVNVTAKFIQQFNGADSRCLNSRNDTPFHVAAKSRNPDAIIYMLDTFAPTNNRWDVDKVDEDQDPENTVINICAREGNANAVALLIKNGADISQGVLHEIVLESVRNPEKIGDLVRVYQSIVDNAVTWLCLDEWEKRREKRHLLIVKGSDEYAEMFRKTMIWLLTEPLENPKYDGKDVLQCALAHGASAMFWQIINTKSVFRIQGKETVKFVEDENNNEDENGEGSTNGKRKTQKNLNWTVFDVTNFTEETKVEPFSSASQAQDRANSSKDAKSRLLNKVNQHKPTESVEQSKIQSSSKPCRNLDICTTPEMPYLIFLLTVFDQWKGSNILSTQPLKELTSPYVKTVQRSYLLIGLLQLFFMLTFTVEFTPNSCSLAELFNISATGCGNGTRDDGAILHARISKERSWLAAIWLIWPTVLLAGNLFVTFVFVGYENLAHEQKERKKVVKSKDLRSGFQSTLRQVLLRTMALRIFCCMVFLWTYVHFWGDSHEWYVEVTAMVLLFGWITNLEFFGAMGKSFSIFDLVVQEIIVKDIPSFMLFFGFTVVGFSFAMHTIRMSVCMHNQAFYLNETFFAVLSSAFGIGDFFDSTVTDSTCAGGATHYLFEFVYLGYVCVTMIILLNVLIAMMNNRYEKAKRRAENIRRFRILSMMRAMERYQFLRKLMMPLRSAERTAKFRCCNVAFVYKNFGSLIYNKKLNRYYLRLLLPVDKRLEQR